MTEHEIQDQIRDYLERKGYYVMRLNSGLIKKRGAWMKLAKNGTPDLMFFKQVAVIGSEKDMGSYGIVETNLQLFFIEVKKPGENPTEVQIAKMKELEGYGAKCYVARSVEEVMKVC